MPQKKKREVGETRIVNSKAGYFETAILMRLHDAICVCVCVCVFIALISTG